jgi:hypothetical protein
VPESERLRAVLNSSFPPSFIRELTPCVTIAYRDALEELSGLPDEVLHDVLPHYRRARVQHNVHMAARRYRDRGVRATWQRNQAENCFHTLISAGNALLSENAVATERTVVRDARFREGYAQNNQLSLFEPAPMVIPANAQFWFLLIHGPSGRVPAPGFVRIVFPLPDLSGYVDDGIDLMRLYVADATAAGVQVEEIEERMRVELREEFQRAEQLSE